MSQIQHDNFFWSFSTTDDETTKKVAEKLEELSVKEDKTVEEKDQVEEKKEDVKAAEEKKWENYELALQILFFSFPPTPFFLQ